MATTVGHPAWAQLRCWASSVLYGLSAIDEPARPAQSPGAKAAMQAEKEVLIGTPKRKREVAL